jgi:hypothetical protein
MHPDGVRAVVVGIFMGMTVVGTLILWAAYHPSDATLRGQRQLATDVETARIRNAIAVEQQQAEYNKNESLKALAADIKSLLHFKKTGVHPDGHEDIEMKPKRPIDQVFTDAREKLKALQKSCAEARAATGRSAAVPSLKPASEPTETDQDAQDMEYHSDRDRQARIAAAIMLGRNSIDGLDDMESTVSRPRSESDRPSFVAESCVSPDRGGWIGNPVLMQSANASIVSSRRASLEDCNEPREPISVLDMVSAVPQTYHSPDNAQKQCSEIAMEMRENVKAAEEESEWYEIDLSDDGSVQQLDTETQTGWNPRFRPEGEWQRPLY